MSNSFASPTTGFGSPSERRIRVLRYAIVIEKAESNFSAYVPDLPGCVATGQTVEKTEISIREAIEFHLDGMSEDGLSTPVPSSRVKYVEVGT